jgi:osmotically-inducible protein OsmY
MKAMLLAVLMATAMVGCSSSPTQQSTGQAIDDGVVTAKVKAKLIEDPVTKAHQIDVETFKGTVQLSGFVETDQARSRALKLARDVEGVKYVKDALEVRKSTT